MSFPKGYVFCFYEWLVVVEFSSAIRNHFGEKGKWVKEGVDCASRILRER